MFCFKNTSFSADDYKIYIEDAVNEDGYSKFKIRIFNKTNDYLIFKPGDAVFKIGSREIICKEKQIVILPNEESWKVLSVKGKGLQEEKFSVEIKQLYKVSSSVESIKVENLDIPLKKNEVIAGKFKCSIKEEIKTRESILKCECIYDGEGVGILAPGKIVAIMPKGQENANADKFKACLLEKGKSERFFVEFKEMKGGGDMQTSPFKMVWGETFKESKTEPIKGAILNFEIDVAKTAEKNK